MPEIKTEGVATTSCLVKKPDLITKNVEIFRQAGLLDQLETSALLKFSAASVANLQASADTLKERLLTAVVNGDEDSAREIASCYPNLLRSSSTFVKDLTGKITYSPTVAKDPSGKIIKELTPLQAAICAGDVEMAEMLKEFMPADEVLSQFEKIYPDGIDAVETEQKRQAHEFKTTKLRAIFNAINAPDADVAFELETPGQRIDSALNNALHSFREDFAYTSNNEQIFNPYYLLSAFEFYGENFDNFADWNRRDLFWWQIIGYMQRHLPACYLQAFARSIYDIVEHGAKLERTFEFHYWRGHYMRPDRGDLNNLGYNWAWQFGASRRAGVPGLPFSEFIANKKIRFGELTQPETQWLQLQHYLPTRCAIM